MSKREPQVTKNKIFNFAFICTYLDKHVQIFLQAAEYYSDAAAHDHADALYNLGVFYAQGKGGLPLNINIARVYFTKAAKLGQVQARQALDLEKPEIPLKKSNTSTVQNTYFSNTNLEKNKIDNVHVKLSDYMLKENIADVNANFVEKSTCEAESIEYSAQKILNFLGLKDQGVLMANDNCVPC